MNFGRESRGLNREYLSSLERNLAFSCNSQIRLSSPESNLCFGLVVVLENVVSEGEVN